MVPNCSWMSLGIGPNRNYASLVVLKLETGYHGIEHISIPPHGYTPSTNSAFRKAKQLKL